MRRRLLPGSMLECCHRRAPRHVHREPSENVGRRTAGVGWEGEKVRTANGGRVEKAEATIRKVEGTISGASAHCACVLRCGPSRARTIDGGERYLRLIMHWKVFGQCRPWNNVQCEEFRYLTGCDLIVTESVPSASRAKVSVVCVWSALGIVAREKLLRTHQDRLRRSAAAPEDSPEAREQPGDQCCRPHFGLVNLGMYCVGPLIESSRRRLNLVSLPGLWIVASFLRQHVFRRRSEFTLQLLKRMLNFRDCF